MDMLPAFAVDDTPYYMFRDAIHLAYARQRINSLDVKGLNFTSLCVSERSHVTSFASGMAILSDHIIGIILRRARKQMRGVTTGGIVAVVTGHVLRWQRPVGNLICMTTSISGFAPDAGFTVTPYVKCPHPRPAGIRPAAGIDLRPEGFDRVGINSTGVMAVNKLNMLTTDVPDSKTIMSGDRCDLTAAAHTQTARVRRGWWDGYDSLGVAAYITDVLACDVAPIVSCLFGYWSRLAAATMTKAGGVGAEGARIKYTSHADLLIRVRPRSGVPSTPPGHLCAQSGTPNYTILRTSVLKGPRSYAWMIEQRSMLRRTAKITSFILGGR